MRVFQKLCKRSNFSVRYVKNPLDFRFSTATLDIMSDGDSLAYHQASPIEVTPDSCQYQGCAELRNHISWLICSNDEVFQRAYLFYSDLDYIARFHGADA